ncbi:MAG: amino acid aminotransferase [Woeseiaceae bacterium]|nr:amino acid aminotransferase [Woeseiaceae bacterium]
MFEKLEPRPADAILKLIAEYKNDDREQKIDLGVGVYRTADGETPVLKAVKAAEKHILETQDSKAYLGTAGEPAFNAAMQTMTFADSVDAERLVTVQGPGGSGSLRVAAALLLRARPDCAVWVTEPTWANHVPLLGGAGLDLKSYPYYNTETHVIEVERMLEGLRAIPKGDIVLFHACCHNPTGMDPDEEQWRAIVEIVAERGLVPFVDMAYQGFARGIDDDAFAIRHLAQHVDEMLVTNSCSKNFGLYRDRVGILSVLSKDAATKATVASQLSAIARTIYSMPPDHGARIVATILNDAKMTLQWQAELAEMRERITGMRELLHEALADKAPDHDFSHLVSATGMFSFLGLAEEQVNRLKSNYGIYMVGSSRINVAGINADNVEYLAESIAAVL